MAPNCAELRRIARRARPEIHLDVVVGDHGHLPPEDRHDDLLPHQVLVPLVLRVDAHRGVAEDRLRPRRRHRDVLAAAVVEVILEVVELALLLGVLDLEVGDGGAERRRPVHHVLAAVDQPLLVEVDEGLGHRLAKLGLERELLARPVARGAEAADLPGDLPALLGLPPPHALEEGVAAHRRPRRPFGDELALDEHLRRDARVVTRTSWRP